ncbi:hypothetical protein NPIL_58341 [Nephila pilipes]|uniref:Uncharacterized protein n=1 Tax=Nephila pilipes TaxID=299642 RepID=A0A8X6NKH1_NEPPI|nr:hypothetical protein NPIL_58341 [Nephila pilipes]
MSMRYATWQPNDHCRKLMACAVSVGCIEAQRLQTSWAASSENPNSGRPLPSQPTQQSSPRHGRCLNELIPHPLHYSGGEFATSAWN